MIGTMDQETAAVKSPVPRGTQSLADNSCNSQGMAWLTESPAVPEETQRTLAPQSRTVALLDSVRDLRKSHVQGRQGLTFFHTHSELLRARHLGEVGTLHIEMHVTHF